MNDKKNNPIEKKDEIVNLYKAGTFYGTISLKDFLIK
jgi:hypothetical protein